MVARRVGNAGSSNVKIAQLIGRRHLATLSRENSVDIASNTNVRGEGAYMMMWQVITATGVGESLITRNVLHCVHTEIYPNS